MHSSMERNSGRNTNYINVARGIAIICIIVGHTRCPEYLWRFFSFFHVPAFFFISGFFYKESYSRNPVLLVKKRLRSLYLPFIKYELIFLALHNVFFDFNLYNFDFPVNGNQVIRYSLKQILSKAAEIILTFGATEEIIWGFWFIQSLFTISIIFVLISWMVKNNNNKKEEYRCLLVLSVFLFGIILAEKNIHLPRNMVSSFVGVLFFYLGFIFSRKIKNVPINLVGCVIALMIMITSLLVYDEHLGFANHHYVRFQYFTVNALLGIYVLFYTSKKIEETKFSVVLELIGENTYHILALHILSFKSISFLQIKLYDLPSNLMAKYPVITYSGGWWWLLYALAGIFIPVLLRQCYRCLKSTVQEWILRMEGIP